MYYSGLSVVEDRQKARLLISEAAHKNFVKAQVEYASLFLIGSGGTVDMTAALKWFRLAEKNGDPHASEYAELTQDIIQLSRIGNSARQANKRWMKVAIVLALIEKNSQRDELEFIKKLQSFLKQNGAEFTSGEIREIKNRVTPYAEQRKEWIARQQEKAPQ
jgi:TPR repeat protein